MPTEKATLAKGGACMACKTRKVKCSGTRPSCEACQRSARFRGEDPDTIVCSYLKGRKCGQRGDGAEHAVERHPRPAKRAYKDNRDDLMDRLDRSRRLPLKHQRRTDGNQVDGSAISAKPTKRVRLLPRQLNSAPLTESPSPTGTFSASLGSLHMQEVSAYTPQIGPTGDQLHTMPTTNVLPPSLFLFADPDYSPSSASSSERPSPSSTPFANPASPADPDDDDWRDLDTINPGDFSGAGLAITQQPTVADCTYALLPQSFLYEPSHDLTVLSYHPSPAPCPQELPVTPELSLTELYTHAFLPTAHNFSDTISLPFLSM